MLVLAIASEGSHMLARHRHYSLLDQRVIEAGDAVHGRFPASREDALSFASLDDRDFKRE